MAEYRNIVILIADSLRYDSVPPSIHNESKSDVIPTLAPSLHSPTSFASFFTARSAQNHNVDEFCEELDASIPNAFDFFDHTSFYHGEAGSVINDYIFQSELQELTDIEEPFLWIERVMETHLPYGRLGHGQKYDFEMRGRDYIDLCRTGDLDAHEEYQKGIDGLSKHFKRHINELEERGILDETLVILTSDHGEYLGERILGQRRYDHNYPPSHILAQVPTVFYNYDLDVSCMRTIDILPTAFGIVGKDPNFGDGADVRKEPAERGRVLMSDIKADFDLTWAFNGTRWAPTPKSNAEMMLKTLWGDTKKWVYRHGYKQLDERITQRLEEDTDETSDIDI